MFLVHCLVSPFSPSFFLLVIDEVVHDLWSLLFSGAGAEKLLKFKKWFWSIVEKMSNSDRQDLVSVLIKAILLNFGVWWFWKLHFKNSVRSI